MARKRVQLKKPKSSRPKPKVLGKQKDIKNPLPSDFNLIDELFPVFKRKPVRPARKLK